MIGRAPRQHEEGAVAPARRRFESGRGEEDEVERTTAAGEVGCRCRSFAALAVADCVALAVADCVALGCCPCAVVGMLGLALVRAPIAVVRRLIRRRRRALLCGKRVRDVAATAASASDDGGDGFREKGAEKEVTGVGAVDTTTCGEVGEAGGGDDHEEELAWLEEMYRTGRWGFGRVSFSAKTP